MRSGSGALHRAWSQTAHVRDILANQHELLGRYQVAGMHPPGLTGYELRVFSQNGEDGVVAELLRRCGVRNKYFVEFGVENGSECNTAFLAHTMGWTGVYFEPELDAFHALEFRYRPNPKVSTLSRLVTAENVEAIFEEAGVPPEFDVLGIDIDGNDYWVWKAIISYRPTIVIIEYNGQLDPDVERVQPYAAAAGWDASSGYGSSLAAYEKLARHKGYRLAHTESTGVNAFFIRDDIDVDLPTEVPRRTANFAFSGGGWHPSPKQAPLWQQPSESFHD